MPTCLGADFRHGMGSGVPPARRRATHASSARRTRPRIDRPDPRPRVHRVIARSDQHDDEHEQDHDRPGVDDDFQGRHERGAQEEHDDRDRQERHDEVQQRMHGVAARDHHDRGRDCDARAEGEDEVHGRRLRRSTGGRSFSASPLPLPLISIPETR